MTIHEIAKVLGISRTRVQQIEASGLAKIRNAFGSDATGPASVYLADSCGVPEPAGDESLNREANSRRVARQARSRGRFANG